MKFKIFLFFFALGIVNTFSQVVIGDPNGFTDLLPIDGTYEYSYTQQIVYQNEIGAGGAITSISFKYMYGATSNSNLWEFI